MMLVQNRWSWYNTQRLGGISARDTQMSPKEEAATKVVLVAASVFLLAAGIVSARYSGGDGSPQDPYRIATPNDLNDIGNHIEDFNKHFVMVNDINLAAYAGTQFNIIGPNIAERFMGVFDGNSYTISNFTYNKMCYRSGK